MKRGENSLEPALTYIKIFLNSSTRIYHFLL